MYLYMYVARLMMMIKMDDLLIISSCLVLGFLALYVRRWRSLLPPSPLPLPLIGHLHLLSPLIHHSFRNLSLRYGPLYSLKLGSVQALVVSSPDIAKEFLKTHEPTFSTRMYTIAIKRLTYDSAYAFGPIGPYWRFINKLSMTHLLNPRALSQFLPVRSHEVQHFIRLLDGRRGSSVNVTQEIVRLSNNVIFDMMFGIRTCSREEEAQAMALAREVTQLFGQFNVSDFLWLAKGLDLQKFNVKIEDLHRRYDSFLEGVITKREELRKRMKRDKDHPAPAAAMGGRIPFLDLLLDAMEDDSSQIRITRNNVKALILDFLTAATDTSAISIEWSLAELINNPRVAKKARDEIDQVVGANRLVEESDLPNLPYIQAVIKESFRLHPPVPLIIRKSTDECKVNEWHIPENTLVFINIWAMARDPKCWDNPMDFMPERFLQPNDGSPMGLMELRGQNFHLLPFGSGRRGCPGANFALQMVPTVLAALIQCFEWRPVRGPDLVDMSERAGLTAPRAYDLVCVPNPRFDLSKVESTVVL